MRECFADEPLISPFHRAQVDIGEMSVVLINEAVMRGTKNNEVVFDVMLIF